MRQCLLSKFFSGQSAVRPAEVVATRPRWLRSLRDQAPTLKARDTWFWSHITPHIVWCELPADPACAAGLRRLWARFPVGGASLHDRRGEDERVEHERDGADGARAVWI